MYTNCIIKKSTLSVIGKIVVSIFILLTLSPLLTQAQNSDGKMYIDTLPQLPMDTIQSELYNGIYNTAKKRTWTKALHGLLFDNSPTPVQYKNIEAKQSVEKEHLPYAGKPIRNVNVITLSPFGTNIHEPDSISSENDIIQTLNSLHINTRRFVVMANLLFKKGDLVDPFIIAESEAYLRELGFIGDARIRIVEIPGNDSIDVNVVTLDRFSFGVNIRNITLSSLDVELFDRNFLGLGNELSLRYLRKNNATPKAGYGISYINPNLFRTFFRTELSYLKDHSSETTTLSAERVIQPNLKYLGGVSYVQRKTLTQIFLLNDTIFNLHQEIFSATIGRVYKIPGMSNDGRFVTTGRFILQNNLSELITNYDYPYLNYPFEKSALWITAFSLFQQRFYRGSMIYNFGVTEDIAYGYNATLQIGYQDHAYFNRMYGSFTLSKGKYYNKIGYFYGKVSYGSFFRNSRAEQGILRLYSSYFSPLLKLGAKSYLRQFVWIDYTQGIRRLKSAEELIYFSYLTTFNTNRFNNIANGTKRFVANFETNWFSPIQLIGFRMVLFSFMNFAWLSGENDRLLQRKNFFSGYGLGVRLRNDLLVIKTIQLRLAWYPQLNQSSFSEFINFSTSEPQASPNFRPEYPAIIPFK